ncbi:MAG: DUF1385 domain-containing protein [Deltaproteobacteria bacterium]|nr:DUF1385 domain-containing protein [bacterium]MCB9488177.1 DUF1385 domain-containing protein [Deltaproteobacteria bacterium]
MSVLTVNKNTGKVAHVGGQAVIEGVMMRSPNSFAVCVRAPDGRIVLREDRWHSIWTKLKFLRWPLLRGTVVLVEAMWNGISSLTFSAKWAGLEDDKADKSDDKKANGKNGQADGAGHRKEAAEFLAGAPINGAAASSPANGAHAITDTSHVDPQHDSPVEEVNDPDSPLSEWAMAATVMVSLGFSILLFVVLPHALTAMLGFDASHWQFHAIDGIIKVTVLVAYIWGISLMPDIRRVFEYHGAEHKAIFVYEHDLPLTVENARGFVRFHPRCGTSFLFLVIATSIIIFSLAFVFLPQFPDMNPVLRNFIYIFIKIPLMFPVAGISYEIIRLNGKYPDNPVLKVLTRPGVWLQHITTREPDDDQLEVALLSLKKCLWREEKVAASDVELAGDTQLFESFQDATESLT